MPSYLTEQDVQDYGTDLLNVSQRAALHALSPQLQRIEQQNEELRQRLAVEARRNLDQRVEKAVPDFRSIDADPRWHQWLRGTDVLSGRARQVLLDDAIASGDATRIANFFRKFLAEAGGAQSSSPAYGQAQSSNGPVYTRSQISQLYSAHRKGAYVGRESEWARIDADIVRAAAEGRVLNPDNITK